MIDTNADERIRKQRSRQTMPYFTMLMAVVYMALGTFLIAAPPGMFVLAQNSRRIAGGLFILYGIIRFVRTIRQHFRKRHDTL